MCSNFSVLMSLYIKESPLFLFKCLESLSIQTVKASEVVLIFDGPITSDLNDQVEYWREELNIKVFPMEFNVGLGEALNYGLSKCNFDIIARMDSDDVCLSDRFEKQLSLFNINADLSICGSAIEEVDPFSFKKISCKSVPINHEDIVRTLPIRNPFNHMTVMYKKNDILKVGGYKNLPWMEDWYLWLRLLTAGYKGLNIADITVRARTGDAMLARRAGLNYVKSEWLISQYMYKFGVVNKYKSLFIFLVRSLPRLLPRIFLKKIYSFFRK